MARTPLVQQGKSPQSEIYQRVISHPQAKLFDRPGGRELSRQVRTFTPLYVYGRDRRGGEEWLEVGFSARGTVEGWLQSRFSTDWKQSMTLKFTDRSGREPTLFFKTRQGLEALIGSGSQLRSKAQALIRQAKDIQRERIQPPANWPVLAVEPEDSAVSRDRFYLLPILDMAEPFMQGKLLQVASIDPGTGGDGGQDALRVGIVFVIDTTISMQPYIEQVRNVVREIFDRLENERLLDRVAFGVVGFRSSTVKTPQLEYVAKKYADLTDGTNRYSLERVLENVREARTSTHSFDEDAFAGIKMAISDMDWEPYHGRIIMLVTDAGALRGYDPYSDTRMDAGAIRELAAEKEILIFPMHLKTPQGRELNNHSHAEYQYRDLSRVQGDPCIGDLYVDVPGGDKSSFYRTSEEIGNKMVDLVRSMSQNRRMDGGAEVRCNASSPNSLTPSQKAALLGVAMRLDFLGKRNNTQAPQVRMGWVSDMDFTAADGVDREAFEVCVLLTRDQLSQLSDALKAVYESAKRSRNTGSSEFFQLVQSAIAQMMRDGGNFRQGRNVGDFLPDYLNDLPYGSKLRNLTQDSWARMSMQEMSEFINDMLSKINLYQAFHDDASAWENFGAQNPGDAVFRVPLSAFP